MRKGIFFYLQFFCQKFRLEKYSPEKDISISQKTQFDDYQPQQSESNCVKWIINYNLSL